MPYSLKKLNVDNYVGDSGPMSVFTPYDGETPGEFEISAKPRIGGTIMVGAISARTYYAQAWWETSLITEILEEREDYVRFRTLNSEYEWKAF